MNEEAPRQLPGRFFLVPTFSIRPRIAALLGREHLELAERGGIATAGLRCRIATRPEEVSGLVIESQRLHGRDHGAIATTRYQQRFFAHLSR